MAFIDYYKILGVPRDIPQADVKKAYHKRAKQFHPDLHPDDPKAKAKFQALNEAFEVINDPEKRAKYDQYGEKWKEVSKMNDNGGGFGFGSSGNPFDGFDFSSFTKGGGFSDFFEQLFGHNMGRSARRGSAGGAQMAEVDLDLYTALLGGDVVVQINSSKKIKLKIKPVVQDGTKVRVRGVDLGNGQKSDLVITYHVKLPTTLSDRQKELLRQMRQG